MLTPARVYRLKYKSNLTVIKENVWQYFNKSTKIKINLCFD